MTEIELADLRIALDRLDPYAWSPEYMGPEHYETASAAVAGARWLLSEADRSAKTIAELETRLSIAADLTIGDRGQIRDLEYWIAAIAATLGADPAQDAEADLATIANGLAAARCSARQLTEQNGELMQRVGELEVENARLRRFAAQVAKNFDETEAERRDPS